MPLEILMPDTVSEKGKGTKLYNLITENFQVHKTAPLHNIRGHNKYSLACLLSFQACDHNFRFFSGLNYMITVRGSFLFMKKL